jgi:hypothetical protein
MGGVGRAKAFRRNRFTAYRIGEKSGDADRRTVRPWSYRDRRGGRVTIDQEVDRDVDADVDAEPERDLAAGREREWRIGTWIIAVALVAWFLVAWLALGRVAWDALGESIVSGMLILLGVTIIGVVRSGRPR